jgi:3-hydroxymyristoyl/3-hydroxydecanoyl-(acyl carrier protein) dehydratase
MSAEQTGAQQTWSGEFTVAPDHPCLPGHFPGEPIVPAVLLLELSCAVLRQRRPELGPPREVKSAKFMRPVRPGETVRVSFSGAAGGALRFSCETAGGIAAQGQLLFTAAA